ncbi:hypothetical protein AMECASPLE_023364 [Ameca splendens]|uniref:Uncharacterized protein n=1 Tax=Ameca splendens TaxID=208324 RepID=A0ABV0Y4L3_9TELE
MSLTAWERLGLPLEELEEVSGERDVWVSLLSLLPPQPAEDDEYEQGILKDLENRTEHVLLLALEWYSGQILTDMQRSFREIGLIPSPCLIIESAGERPVYGKSVF